MSGRRQQGFTLIEIAIVLVIIGLLLGGILKGQQLITNARVRALADQNASIQAAWYGFLDSYRKVPGDMSAEEAGRVIGGGTVGVGGNGNGRLDAVGGSEWTEPNAVWAHLAGAGFINGGYVGADSAPSQERHAPRNVFGGYLVLGQSDDYFDASGTAPERLNLVIGRGVPVGVLRELDAKVDDGLPGSGQLRAVAPGAGARFGDLASAGSPDCVDTGTVPPSWNVKAGLGDCNATFLW